MTNIAFDDKSLNDINFICDVTKKTALSYLETLIKDYERNHGTRTVAHLESRTKKLERAIEKLKEKNLDINVENLFSNVHDMVGIRLVCPFLHDVYDMICLIKSTGLYVCNEKDFITAPKESGYMGYHIIVKIPISLTGHTEFIDAEIQIKTSLMHAWDTVQHNVYEQQRSGVQVNEVKYKLLQDMSKEFMLYDRELDNKFDMKNFEALSTMTNYDELYLHSHTIGDKKILKESKSY